jgi:hypothetical protein
MIGALCHFFIGGAGRIWLSYRSWCYVHAVREWLAKLNAQKVAILASFVGNRCRTCQFSNGLDKS